MSRPSAPEPYTGHNIYLYARHIQALRKAAHERRVSISAIIRDLIQKELAGDRTEERHVSK